MAKKISASDIFSEEDIFLGIRNSAEKTILTFQEIDAEVKKLGANIKKDLAGADFGNTKGINAFVTATQQATKAQKDAVAVTKVLAQAEKDQAAATKALIDIDIKKQKLVQEEIRTATQKAKIEQANAKAEQKEISNAQKMASAYNQLVVKTRELKNSSKELAGQMIILEQHGQKNTKEYRDLAKTYKQVTNEAIKADVTLKKIDSTVGDNFRNVGNYNGSINKLRNGLGQLGLAFGIGTVVTNAGKTLAKFDEASADIAKTVGITKDEARKLSEELLKIDTRSSVEELQKIAGIGGQLGIAKDDIIGFTKATDQLNVALGDEFQGGAEEITKVIGGLRNVFGDIKTDSVEQDLLHIGNALNALGASGSATSPIMADFAGRIGGVGIPLGLTTDEVLGLSATLEELNVTSERGGTAVTKVLQKMTVNTKDFAKLAGMPLKEFENLVNTDIYGAFQKVIEGTKKSGKNATQLGTILDDLKLDGAGTSEVFLKLGSNMDLLDKRTKLAGESLSKTDSITEEAKVKNETLSASVEKLKNAWDKWVIGIDSATGASSGFSSALGFIAKNLPLILEWVGKAVIAWGTYLAISKAIQAYNFVMTGGLKTVASRMLDVFKAGKQAGEGAKIAGEETKKAGKSLTAVPWMVVIGLVIELAMAFYDMASGAKEAREQQELLDKQLELGSKKAEIVVQNLSALTTERMRLLDIEQRKRIANGENEATVIKDILNQKKQAYKSEQEIIDKSINKLDDSVNQLEYYKKRAVDINKTVQKLKFKGGFEAGTQLASQFNALKKIASSMGINPSAFRDAEELAKIIQNHTEAQIVGTEKAIDLLKIQRKETSDAIDELKIQTLEKSKEKHVEEEIVKTGKIKLDQKKDEIKINEELKKSLEELWQIELDRTSTAETILAMKKLAKDDELKLQRELSTDLLNRDQQLKDALILNQMEFDRAMKNLKESEDVVNAQTDVNKIQFQLNKANGLQAIALEFELLSAKHKLLDEEMEAELLAVGNNEKEKLKIRSEYALKHQGLDKEFKDKSIKDEQEKTEIVKKSFENQKEFIKLTADYFIKRSNDKIAQLEKEIAMAEKQSDVLQQLAINGNINAKESLAEQQRIINEANLKKEKELKRQQRIKLAESVYSTYNSKVAGGSEHPLMDTIKDTMLLQQFIASLPTFFDGTENTGKNGNGIDGKGGFHAVLHPNERVIPKSLNEQIGGLSNEALAKMASEYQNGKIIRSNSQIGSAFDTAILVNELKTLNETIKAKPETNIGIGEITQSVMEIVKSTKQGNTTTYNRYKVRR
jgi:TP901 family phage tail tape measure protein